MNGKVFVKVISVVMAAALPLAVAGVASPAPVLRANAESLADLRSKYDSLEQRQQALKNEMADTQADIEKQEKKQQNLEEKISVTREQISILNTEIAEANASIAKREQKIKEKEAEIQQTYTLYKQRVRATYMSADPTMLGVILGAEDLSDFIMRAELVQRVSEHDQQLVDRLKKAKAEQQAEKKQLEADKKELQTAKERMSAKQSDLNEAYQKSASAQVTLEEEYAYYKQNKEAIEKQMAAADQEIQALLAAQGSGGNSRYTGGKFLWPVPGFYVDYSTYGWRTWPDGSREFHKGMDISKGGIYGAKVVAAAGGTVLRAYDNGNGYGIHVLIDHGGGLATLYGHLSSTCVSVGQKVKRGQHIGNVGSTGWSTGPHLHFEVRKNGVHTDPHPYLS